MPELPEVETVKRVLEPQLTDRTIQTVIIHHTQVVAYPDTDVFCHSLIGQKISGMQRRGKFLFLCLESGDRVILHLRMTGNLFIVPPNESMEKHTHLVMKLDNGLELRYNDPRRFGRFWLIPHGEEDTVSGAFRLGPEPFDEHFDASYLRSALMKRKKTLKECLLDQSIVAGIGNIYADEILFTAKLSPLRPANSLTKEEYLRLTVLIPKTLLYYIEKNEISAEDYQKAKGDEYRNTPYLRVYGHDGEPCPVCGKTLCRTIIGGRGSVYCPGCQGK